MSIFDNRNAIKSRVDYFCDGAGFHHDAEYFMQYLYCMLVNEGDTVIDVGANHGLHTIPLAHLVGKKGKVYAFEAIPENVTELINMSSELNVEVVHAAVTNPSTRLLHPTTKFCHVKKLDGFSGILKRPNVLDEWNPVEIEVPTITLDEALPVDSKVTFIKCDVECGDFHVLQGAERIFRESKPIAIFESGRQYAADIYGYSKSDFFDYFNSIDYELFTFTGERFGNDTWVDPVNFWETWAVSKSSPYLPFFRNNLQILTTFYTNRMIFLKNNFENKKIG